MRVAMLMLFVLWIAACARERATPLTDALLSTAARWGDGPDRSDFARAELDRIASLVQRVQAKSPQLPARLALQQVVFEQLGFAREVQDESLTFVLLPAVLQARRGGCVGLGTLYLALAERLGLQMHGVLVPGHFFVRLEEQRAQHNLELLRRGDEQSGDWYRERYLTPEVSARAYGRTLANDEVLGVVEYNIGKQRQRAARWRAAEQAYDSARSHFPELAEAHASAGAVAQLLGALDRSLEAYRAAQRVNPQLPGLATNLALLEAERRHGRLPLQR